MERTNVTFDFKMGKTNLFSPDAASVAGLPDKGFL